MIKRIRFFLCVMFLSLNVYGGLGHKPPSAPESGFGSNEAYIATDYQQFRVGSASDGDVVWYFVPDTLKNGDTAPVVIYLHGFAALYPYVYRTHIEHLLYQGNIVVFPQFQKSSLWGFLQESGLFNEMDQSIWSRRAVKSIEPVMNQLTNVIDEGAVFLYGHSLGGLIALAWQAEGGFPVRGIMLSHPQVDSSAGMPEFVKQLVKVKDIPWRKYAMDIDVPVVILNGDEDNIAPISQSVEIVENLMSSPVVDLYVAQADRYGWPRISPNHGAPLDFINGLPAHLKFFGVSGELDALDWRFYFAALDQFMWYPSGLLEFDLGAWSDGTELLPVKRFSPGSNTFE